MTAAQGKAWRVWRMSIPVIGGPWRQCASVQFSRWSPLALCRVMSEFGTLPRTDSDRSACRRYGSTHVVICMGWSVTYVSQGDALEVSPSNKSFSPEFPPPPPPYTHLTHKPIHSLYTQQQSYNHIKIQLTSIEKVFSPPPSV